MPTYLYECPKHGELEITHSVNETREFCPQCALEGTTLYRVRRLIAGGTTFKLEGAGWAKDGYSRG